jgi:hypothetical protein
MEAKDNLNFEQLRSEMNNFVYLLPDSDWKLDPIRLAIQARIKELLETEFKDIDSAGLFKRWSDSHDAWIKIANNRRKSPRTKQKAFEIVQKVEFEVLSTLYPLFKKMLSLGYVKRTLMM